MFMRISLTLTVLATLAVQAHAETTSTDVEGFLIEGKLADGKAAMQARVAEAPKDSEAQYAVGIFSVLIAAENLSQNLYRYGLRPDAPRAPFVRMPVPKNPDPEELTYEKWRAVLQQFIDDLAIAEAELAKVDDPEVKLKLPVGMVRMDLNGDGKAEDGETFWKVFTAVAWRAAKLDEDEQRFEIGFDKADVHWMIGYTHLLRAMAEAYLASDTSEFFANTASIFFEGVESPLAELHTDRQNNFMDQIADAVLTVHLMKFELVEPERMEVARQHLLTMISQSRLVWQYCTQETDNDREWIPNAKQTSLTPLTVNEARVAGWAAFLNEAEEVLEGKKLLPHWRVNDGRGINLRRVFTEPTNFDLIGWVHGVSALPYLEEGDKVSMDTARTLSRTFEGRFLVFAVWFQ
ncbi:hypothetical protein C5Y96_14435 [Blastopirellula marina]|uniref:Uncharacterized protein n=1 Tax=Blastopirellula marina TaxID=124 RepID=A0A2S8FES2_9BACT|nr:MULTISPECIES: hypothetical protein [Pirellulaceae]PQO30659.1 hypothetical protein C5Y96_14435 [Blastopirellula marina]RCS50796.1 hypothetical protein DTL36_14445 [Bremerella cremea]